MFQSQRIKGNHALDNFHKMNRHTANRRAYRESDYATTRPLTRKLYATEADAIAAMFGNDIAFRTAHIESVNKWDLSILGAYYVIARAKPSAPWKQIGSVLGSCDADAHSIAENDGILGSDAGLARVVSDHDWIAIQSKQHLRAVGIR